MLFKVLLVRTSYIFDVLKMFLNLKYLQPIWILILFKLFSNAEAQVPLTRIGFLETLGDKQYFIENSLKVNWYRAVQLCNKLNMTLASIESSTEQTKLKSFLYLNCKSMFKYPLKIHLISLNFSCIIR